MIQPALRVEGVTKSYGALVALEAIDLSIEPGEVVALLGPNGAGKTTLVSIICGLRRADRGRVLVRGIDVRSSPEQARAHIGLAPQDLGIYPLDTARENMALFGGLTGLRGAALSREIAGIAGALRLDGLLDRKAGELSGGEKRRLHTALALLNRPSLILLDEATVGADVDTRAALVDVVKEMAARGSAVLYSTHYLHEVEQLGARVVILDRGRVISEGSVGELLARNGSSVVEMTFSGKPPRLGDSFAAAYRGSVIRVEAEDPGRALGRILSTIGKDLSRLQSVEVINPSLETVFLSLTGRRYRPETEDVLAS